MSVVTNGQPNASIAFCACFCKPSRETVKAGNATMEVALLIRSAIIAIAFATQLRFDRGTIGFTAADTTGDIALSDGTAIEAG